jgi:hypothetical protein
LTKDATLRQALGFSRVPHRRTLERRLDATLPEAEAQVQVRSRTRDLRILFRGFSRSVCVVSISRSSGLKSDF